MNSRVKNICIFNIYFRELTEKNATLESALVKINSELQELEREKKALETQIDINRKADEKREEEINQYEKKVKEDLKRLKDEESDLQRSLNQKRDLLEKKKAEVSSLKETHV